MSSRSFLLCSALISCLRSYNMGTFRQDLMAGFVVSLMALPISMALSIAVGLPPHYGLYTAIVAGFVTPLLGGSRFQVSGPTAAFVVILAPIVSQSGHHGLIWCSIMAGFMLLLMGILRLGRFIHHIPHPVITGFTSGIAVVLGLISFNDFFGLRIPTLDGSFIHKLVLIFSHLPVLDLPTSAVALVTLFLMITGHHLIRIIPSAVFALVVGSLFALLLRHMGYTVDTVGSVFSYLSENGTRLFGIPPYIPTFHMPTPHAGELLTLPSLSEAGMLVFPAVTIAVLAAIESLLSAKVADDMTHTRHEPNAELGAIGIGNILSGLATGIPATGAIARTSVNIQNQGQTPVASALHALFLAAYVSMLAPIINYLPMACLAALLLHTAYHIANPKHFIRALMFSSRHDVITLLICFILTMFINMVAGVFIGMLCHFFLKKMAR